MIRHQPRGILSKIPRNLQEPHGEGLPNHIGTVPNFPPRTDNQFRTTDQIMAAAAIPRAFLGRPLRTQPDLRGSKLYIGQIGNYTNGPGRADNLTPKLYYGPKQLRPNVGQNRGPSCQTHRI
jgi:hypothetical protein